jgi:hypothetical protein
VCTACNSSFTATSRLRAALDHGFQRCFGKPMPTEEEVYQLVWTGLPPQPSRLDERAHDCWLLQCAAVQFTVSIHDWRHRSSCFKGKRCHCRYKTPMLPCDSTSVAPVLDVGGDASAAPVLKLDIDVKRRPCFAFLTDFNADLMSVLPCNNCVRYVVDQKVSMYYGAYTTKHNKENERSLAKLLQTMRGYEARLALSRQQDAKRTDASFGFGRMLSSARAATAGETVGGPLLAFHALGNKIFQTSHDTHVLALMQGLAFLHQQPLRASIDKSGRVNASVHEYVFRGDDLPPLHWWDLIEQYEVVKLKGTASARADPEDSGSDSEGTDADPEPDPQPERKQRRGRPARTIHRFRPAHPRYATHGLARRTRLVWPRFSGRRLPDLLDIRENSDLLPHDRADKQERYAQGVLVMFMPFRELSDLLLPDESWWAALQRLSPVLDASSKVVRIRANMQNFYESFCRKNIDTKFDDNDPHEGARGEPADDHDAPDLGLTDLSDSDDEDDTKAVPLTILEKNLLSAETNPILVTPRPCSTPTLLTAANAALRLLPSKSSKKNFDVPEQLHAALPGAAAQKPTKILQLADMVAALNKKQHTDSKYVDEPVPLPVNYPTIEDQSKHYTLNAKQHVSFVLLAAALLSSVFAQQETGDPQHDASSARVRALLAAVLPKNGQLRLYLGGSGGTGKSRVVQALIDFARRWTRSDMVAVTASSGIAGVLIGGCTIHAALGINVSLKPPAPQEKHIRAWSPVTFLFLDEISMVQPALLDLIDRRLQQLKVRSGVPFGGLHVCFSGDFFQLPPVGPRLYAELTARELDADGEPLGTQRGQDLWNSCLTDALLLDEIVRQGCPRWAASLNRWRLNQPTQQDIDDVMARLLPQKNSMRPGTSDVPPAATPVAVARNRCRFAGTKMANAAALASLGPVANKSWRERGAILVQATVRRAKGHQPLHAGTADRVRGRDEKKLGLVGDLYALIGTTYIVSQNADLNNKIANGTQAVLQDVVLLDDAHVRVVAIPDGMHVHAVYADEVATLVFKHTHKEFKMLDLFPPLPSGCFPGRCVKKNARVRNGTHGSFDVRIVQFPATPAKLITGHKLQGQSLDSLIVGAMAPEHKFGQTGWLYVTLSRVKSIGGLFLLTPIETDPSKYKPRPDVMALMHRMESLESATLARLQVTKEAQIHYPFTVTPVSAPSAAPTVPNHNSPPKRKRTFAKRKHATAHKAPVPAARTTPASAHKTSVPQNFPAPRHARPTSATPIKRVHVVPPAFPSRPQGTPSLSAITPLSASSTQPLPHLHVSCPKES